MEENTVVPDRSDAQALEGFAQSIDADNVAFSDGLAGMVNVQQDMTMNDAAAIAAVVGGDLQIMDGGAVALVVGGSTEINDGGAAVMVANNVTAQKSAFGVVFGPVTMEEGSTMLMDGKLAAVFGAAFGAVVGLVLWLLRKR